MNLLNRTVASYLRLKSSKSSRQRVNFINIIRMPFSFECHFGSFFYLLAAREKLPKQRLYTKFVCIMLMKLTKNVSNFNFDYFLIAHKLIKNFRYDIERTFNIMVQSISQINLNLVMVLCQTQDNFLYYPSCLKKGTLNRGSVG